jgi:sporulation protein YtfJ
MKTAMEQITEMVNIDTVVGSPIETPNGSVILPISKVGFGFAAGGSEFTGDVSDNNGMHKNDAHNASVQLPFGGGSGGGVSITPIAFLVVGSDGVKVVPLDNQTHIFEKLIDSAPQVVEKLQSMLKGSKAAGAMAGGAAGMMTGSAGMTGSMTGGAGSTMAGTTPTTTTTNIIV